MGSKYRGISITEKIGEDCSNKVLFGNCRNDIISERQLKLSLIEQNYTTDYTAHQWLSWLSIGLLSAGGHEFDSGRTNTQGLKVLQYEVLSPTSQPRAFHEDRGNQNGYSSNKQRIVHYCLNGNDWYFQPAHNAISDI